MGKSRDLTQVDLRSGDTWRTCWVDSEVKVGDRITIKNEEDTGRLWRVMRAGPTKSASSIHTDWHNNI